MTWSISLFSSKLIPNSSFALTRIEMALNVEESLMNSVLRNLESHLEVSLMSSLFYFLSESQLWSLFTSFHCCRVLWYCFLLKKENNSDKKVVGRAVPPTPWIKGELREKSFALYKNLLLESFFGIKTLSLESPY